MENMTTIENHYLTLTEDELMNVEGGGIPVAIWAIWGAATAAGFTGGIAVGLNRVNRK